MELEINNREKDDHTTHGIKHWDLSAYLSILQRIKFSVTGQECSPQAPTISYRQNVIGYYKDRHQ